MQIEIIEKTTTGSIVQVTDDWPEECRKNIGKARKHLKEAIDDLGGLDGIDKKEHGTITHVLVMDGIEI